jgi:hypothetical protein
MTPPFSLKNEHEYFGAWRLSDELVARSDDLSPKWQSASFPVAQHQREAPLRHLYPGACGDY